jgi:glycosyltransferase involved in cell wall biosynthesis
LKKILLFAYYWPPAGGIAPMRWLRMTHFLAQAGFDITVMTPSNGSFAYQDNSLSQRVHPNIKVIKTYSLEPLQWYQRLMHKKGQPMPLAEFSDKKNGSIFSRFSLWLRANIFIPDARIGWVPFAYHRACKEFKKSNFDVIITTGPPQSAHLIGLLLKKKFNVRWMADFRDPWTEIFYYDQLPHLSFVKKLDKKLEDKVVRNADVITTVGFKMAELFASRAKRVEVIYNGFDGEVKSTPTLKNKQFIKRISYIGSFLEGYENVVFWDALNFYIQRKNNTEKEISLEFYGTISKKAKEVIISKGLENFTNFHGVVGHGQAIEAMQTSDLLLFVLPNSKSSELIISGKLFEYLKSNVPILAIGKVEGEAASILKETTGLPMLDYYDFDGILAQLEYHLDLDNPMNNASNSQKYSSQNQSEYLAKILSSL